MIQLVTPFISPSQSWAVLLLFYILSLVSLVLLVRNLKKKYGFFCDILSRSCVKMSQWKKSKKCRFEIFSDDTGKTGDIL